MAGTAVTVPPARDVALMAVAVTAVSTSAPLIAATAAPALAIAAWRNLMAAGVLVPVALVTRRAELRSLGRRGWGLCLLAGTLLAGHFAAWVPSVTLTSVASSTALVATQPVWAALLARASGQQVGRPVWVGILVAVAGAAMITGADVTLSARAVVGDVLALLGGMLAAAYVTAGAAVRVRISTTSYTTVCYSACALLLALVCVLAGQPLAGYPAGTWVKLAALTVGAQLLGHSLDQRGAAQHQPDRGQPGDPVRGPGRGADRRGLARPAAAGLGAARDRRAADRSGDRDPGRSAGRSGRVTG